MSGHKLSHPWKLIPLYGLRINKDDGLKDPIFGDATLLGVNTATDLFAETTTAEGARLITQPLIPMVPGAALPPREYLLEVAPDSFIAVRRVDAADAVQRAGEIRALLTATMMLRAGIMGAFPDRPSSLAWSFGHTVIERNRKGLLTYDKEMRINEHVMLNPLLFTKREIRESWLEGKALAPVPKAGQTWDIHASHPICRLLGDHAISSSWAGRLRTLACHLNDACCAATYEHQLLMAITCLEGIFCTGGMHEKKLLPRLEAFAIQMSDTALTVNTLLDARNKYIHQGQALKEPSKYALLALGLAWAFLDVAALFVTHRPEQKAWEAHLDMLSHHRSVMKLAAENYSEDMAHQIGQQMKAMLETHSGGRLTASRG